MQIPQPTEMLEKIYMLPERWQKTMMKINDHDYKYITKIEHQKITKQN